MTRLAKPEKKAGKGTTNGAECTPNVLARQLGRERSAHGVYLCKGTTYKS
jgi:hypothetical protein